MKSNIAVTVLVLVCSACVFIAIVRGKQIASLQEKAAKLDEVCTAVQAALYSDRRVLKDPASRDAMIDRFGGNTGNTVGDAYATLEWCVPHAAEFVAEFRRCTTETRGDEKYQCLDKVLRAMDGAREEGFP